MDACLIEKQTDEGTRYAVEFTRNNRLYRTLFTSYLDEAKAWGRVITTQGWCASARPERAN